MQLRVRQAEQWTILPYSSQEGQLPEHLSTHRQQHEEGRPSTASRSPSRAGQRLHSKRYVSFRQAVLL